MTEFEIGQRVRIKPDAVHKLHQPWRKRFLNGRAGIIKSVLKVNRGPYISVEWDHRQGNSQDWTCVVWPHEIEAVR